jgi:alpha-L-fucosidase
MGAIMSWRQPLAMQPHVLTQVTATSVLLLLLIDAHQHAAAAAAPPPRGASAAKTTPTAAQTAWQERELGGLITWGMNVPLVNSSSKPRPGNLYQTTGVSMCSGCHWQLDSLPPCSEFEPTALDIPGWVSAAKSFGARYLILAAYHAGGFALWPTNATVPGHGRYAYSTACSSAGPWVQQYGRDIVALFVRECRRQGILPGFYVILGENMFLNIGADAHSHSVDPTGRFAKCTARPLPGQLNITRSEYFAVALEMLGELLTRYGPIYELWFDGGVPLELAEDIGVMVDSHAPGAVSFQGPSRHSAGLSGNVVRWSGTETGHTPAADMWSTIKPGSSGAQTMAYGAGTKPGGATGLEYVPAEQDGAIQSGMNAGGFWYPHSVPKTVTELMSEWEDSVGHNSNYLLELSPDPQGHIPAADVAAYRSFGQVSGAADSEGADILHVVPAPCVSVD